MVSDPAKVLECQTAAGALTTARLSTELALINVDKILSEPPKAIAWIDNPPSPPSFHQMRGAYATLTKGTLINAYLEHFDSFRITLNILIKKNNK